MSYDPYYVLQGWLAAVVFFAVNALLFVPLVLLVLWGDKHQGEDEPWL